MEGHSEYGFTIFTPNGYVKEAPLTEPQFSPNIMGLVKTVTVTKLYCYLMI